MPPQRVAVTGASGFIGRATVAALRERGHEVAELDASTGADVRTADLAGFLDGCASVVHLAGVLGTSELFDRVERAVDVNVRGTVRVLRACEKTGAGYVGITMPDCWPSVYQATKLCAVRLAEAFHDAVGVPVTHVRAFNAYGVGQAHGPGHPQKIVPTFATESWAGRPMPVFGDGLQRVDLVHVDHLGRCLAQAATMPATNTFGRGQTWDAGSGYAVTVLDVAWWVASVTGNHTVEHLPMRVGEVTVSPEVVRADNPGPFGFDVTPFTEFERTVESYRP